MTGNLKNGVRVLIKELEMGKSTLLTWSLTSAHCSVAVTLPRVTPQSTSMSSPILTTLLNIVFGVGLGGRTGS